MPDNANINEIIEIKIDIPAFKKNLKDAEAAYAEFITSINNAGSNVKIGKTGAQFAFIADNIKQLTSIVAQQSEIFSAAMDSFAVKAGGSAEKGAKSLNKAIKEAKQAASGAVTGGDVDDDLSKIEKRYEKHFDNIDFNAAKARDKGRKAEIEDVNKTLSTYSGLFDKLELRSAEARARDLKAAETNARRVEEATVSHYNKLFDAASLNEVKRRNAENTNIEKAQQSAQAAQQKLFDKLQDRAARQRLRVASDDEKAQIKNAQLVEDLKQRVIDAALLRAAKSRERAERAAEKANESKIAKEVAAEEKITAGRGRAILKLQQIREAAERANKQSVLPEIEARAASTLKFSASKAAPQADRQADLNATLRYLAQQEKAIEASYAANQKASQGFFDKLTSNFAGAAGTAIKYALIFKAFSATLQAAAFAIEAPFLAIQRGIGYLAQLETDAAGIEQALLRSVNFSGGLAENLDKARQLSKELAREIEEVAAELNISEAVLNDIARLSIQGGVFNFVKEKDDLLAFVKAYAIAVKSTVASSQAGGSLALAASITEISDLFSSKGTGLSDNKFLKGLDLSVNRWIQIRDSSREYRDLIRQLQPEFDKLNLSVVSVSGTFQALTNRATILVNRLLGLGAIKVFDFLVEGLNKFIKFLKDNEAQVIDVFEKFNAVILSVVKQFESLFKGTDFRPFLENFVVLILLSKNLLSILITTGRVLSAINELPETKDFGPINNLFKEFNEGIKESDRLLEDFKNSLYGKNSANKKLIDIGTIDPKGLPREDTTKASGLASKSFEEDRARVQIQIELLKEKYNELREAEIEAEQERLISRRELADAISELNTKEIAELDKFYAQIQAASTKATALALSTEVDPVKRAEIQKRFSTLFYQTELQKLKDAESLRRLGRQYDRQAAKESFDIKQEELKTELALQEKGLELKRDLIKAEFDAGLRTRVEVAEAEEAVEVTALANRKRLLKDNIDTIAKGHADRVKLEKELELLLQEIDSRAEIRRNNASRARNADEIAAENHTTKLRELVSRSEQDKLSFFNQLSGDGRFTLQLEKILSLRQEDLKLAEEQKAAEVARFRAMKDGTDQARKLEEELLAIGQTRFQNLQDRIENLNNTNTGTLGATLRRVLLRKALKDAEAREREVIQSEVTFGDEAGATAKGLLLTNASKAVADAFRALTAATKTVRQSVLSGLSNLLNTDLSVIFGKDGLLTGENASGVEKFAGGVAIAGAALQTFSNIVEAAKQGFAEGGILGGIGAVGSIVGTALQDVPVVGPLVQGFSQAFTAIGALLTKSARNLADKFQRQFDAALQSLADGESTLVDTITVVKAQRDRAIVELSGKKGGKAELDKLLPGFDNEIKNLLKQQQDIIKAFDKELQLLNLQSDVLAETATAWDAINEKVKEYIGAGGDAAKAAQFLELQVAKIRQQSVDELNSAEQEAIQQMTSFNELLKDRQRLIDDFRKKEFDLIAGGAIERRGAGAITRGRELAELRAQFQEQLTALDDQIRLETIKVERTREVFNLTNDIAELKRRDEAFTLAALDAQISRWRQLQELVRGISGGGQGFLNGIAPASGSIFNVTINAGAGADGAAIANDFSTEMSLRIRQGLFN